MTRILITTVFFLFSLFVKAQEKPSSKNQINVVVKHISSDNGKIYFALYDKNGFSPRKPLAKATCAVKNQTAKVHFDAVPNGNYAILCFLDENNNKRLDFNTTNGRPLELYGISNNPVLFGPPQFEQAKFNVKDSNIFVYIFLQ